MEYEFQRNTHTGELIADFSHGQEILGFWFVEELGESTDRYQTLCQVITQLHNHELKHWQMIGKALSIELDTEAVRIFANEIDNDQDIEFDDTLSLYDGESETFCGLADFQLALTSWHRFIQDAL